MEMTGREKVNRLMYWGGDLPKPFEKFPHTNNNHCSKYTSKDAVAATNRISYTNSSFLLDVYYAMNPNEKNPNNEDIIAMGGTVNEFTCERMVKNSSGTFNYEIAIYKEGSDYSFQCFVVDGNTNKIISDPSKVSQSTILCSLWEQFYQDEEFYEQWNLFCDNMNAHDYSAAFNPLSVLNDNIYRRIVASMIEIKSFGEMQPAQLIESEIASGQHTPTGVTCGEFRFLKNVDCTNTNNSIKHDDFVGKYVIDKNRIYTEEEKTMMNNNRLEDYYIIDNDDIEICNDIVKTSNSKKPFRNFVLVGPPGSGKSEKAKAVANGIMLPEVIHCCNPSTEIFDFIGQVMPPSRDELEKEAWNMAAKLEEMGGINFRNIAKLYDLPIVEDIIVAPEEVYYDITKRQKTPLGMNPTVTDAVKAWTEHMVGQFNDAIIKLKVTMKEGAGFTFTETDFIRAIKNGWVVEIQEPNVILNEGVLVGLNSILNEGVITLQTGKTIRRHKDSVIIFTTNNNLYGLRNMNQSFLDRSAETFYINRPPAPVVADRIMSISGLEDRKMAIEMANLGEEISDAMEKEGIDDGICGMRSLINWAIKCSYCNPYDAAIKTVINKTSLDEKNRNRLMKKLNESWFYQFRGK